MSKNDWRSENTYARFTDSTSGYGSAMSLRWASANINSGSSVPSIWRWSSAFGKALPSITAASWHGTRLSFVAADVEVTMAAQPIEIILLRELADHLSTAIFVVDPAGDLVYYNEPAEGILGTRYDETGSMPLSEWSTIFKPTNGRGVTIPPEKLPLAITLAEQRPAQGRIWISGLDGARRRIEIAAIPLKGQWGDELGAVAIFWEPE